MRYLLFSKNFDKLKKIKGLKFSKSASLGSGQDLGLASP